MNFFEDKLEYTYLCNEKIIKLLIENESIFNGRIEGLICHTVNAHLVWLQRILNISPTVKTFQIHPLHSLLKMNQSNFEGGLNVLNSYNLETELTYHNSLGLQFTNKIDDILFHIINHSSYHRGQLILLLKDKGLAPIVTDYIFYKTD